MPSNLETGFRRIRWDTSKRPQRTPTIDGEALQRALDAHIAGNYEDAIAMIQVIPDWETDPGAWRIIGLAQHGLGHFDAAIEAHSRAKTLHADTPQAMAEDEVNIASVYISKRDYEAAWSATERAHDLAPGLRGAWMNKIALLNLQENQDALRALLSRLISEIPEFTDDPVLNDHLVNDGDFIGVSRVIAELQHEPQETSR